MEGRAGTLKPRLLRGLRRKLLEPPSQVDDLRSGPLDPALFTCRRTWELAQVRRGVGPGHGACGAQWQWHGAAGRRSLPPGRAGAAAGPARCPGQVAPATPGCPPPLTAGGQLRGRRALAARVPAETRVSSCSKYRPPPFSRGADLLFSLNWGGGRRGAGRGREEESLTLGRGAAGGEPAPRVCCPRGRRSRPGRSASAALGGRTANVLRRLVKQNVEARSRGKDVSPLFKRKSSRWFSPVFCESQQVKGAGTGPPARNPSSVKPGLWCSRQVPERL